MKAPEANEKLLVALRNADNAMRRTLSVEMTSLITYRDTKTYVEEVAAAHLHHRAAVAEAVSTYELSYTVKS